MKCGVKGPPSRGITSMPEGGNPAKKEKQTLFNVEKVKGK